MPLFDFCCRCSSNLARHLWQSQNFLAMEESPGKMYALATILILLALVAVILRFHARRMKNAKLSWDDYLIFVALVSTVATGICMYVGASMGDLGRHTETRPQSHQPIFTRRTEIFLQVEYAVWITQTLTLGFTKMSVLLFYRRYQHPTLVESCHKLSNLFAICSYDERI